MQKNVASQKLIVFAFDSTTNLPKTGDAANITAYESIDYGAVTVLGDTSATEMDATNAKGYYLFDLTQGETNGNTLLFSAKSVTSNIVVIGVPATVFTDPANYTLTSIDGSGRLDIIKIAGTSQTARDIGASVLLSTGTGTGQLDFTAGVVKANATQWLGGTIPAVNVTGVPLVDLKYTLGTISPAQAGSVASDWGATTNKTATAVLSGTTVAAVSGAVGSVTGNVGGSVGSISGITFPTNFATLGITAAGKITEVVLADTLTTYTGNTLQSGDVYAVLATAANAEPTTPPASNAILISKLAWVFAVMKNKITQTATTQLVRNDADSATIGTSTVSDDGTTAVRGKYS